MTTQHAVAPRESGGTSRVAVLIEAVTGAGASAIDVRMAESAGDPTVVTDDRRALGLFVGRAGHKGERQYCDHTDKCRVDGQN